MGLRSGFPGTPERFRPTPEKVALAPDATVTLAGHIIFVLRDHPAKF